AAGMEESRLHRESALALARQYRELAIGFDCTGAQWGEATWHGPFTDRLAVGQSVVIGLATRVEPSDLEGRRRGGGEAWPIAQGTVGVVMKDWAYDDDDCEEFRGILMRFVEGPRRGEIGCVERIYLRRSP